MESRPMDIVVVAFRARELDTAVRADEGELLASVRIPHADIEEAESVLIEAADPSTSG